MNYINPTLATSNGIGELSFDEIESVSGGFNIFFGTTPEAIAIAVAAFGGASFTGAW